MFHVISGVLALYVIWRVIFPMALPLRYRLACALVIMLGAEHQLITRTFFGSMASPEIPFAWLIGLSWLFGAVCLSALLLMLKDAIGGVWYLLSKRSSPTLLTSTLLARGVCLFAAILSAIGVWQAVRVPDVKKIEITLPNLPQQLDGFRLVQLTDLHASRLLQAAWMDAVVEKTNALAPDLTVITGDLVDGTPEARYDDVQPLRKLRARHGIYAIPGNHEYYADYASWLATFQSLNVPMLLNAHVEIDHHGGHFVLAGVTDTIAPNFQQTPPDLQAALREAPQGIPVILLAHRPIDAPAHAHAGIALQLSGHTHGGQILGFHKLVQWANKGFVSGLYQIGDMQLYVSNGAGLWAGLAMRLGRPSEITEITLRRPN